MAGTLNWGRAVWLGPQLQHDLAALVGSAGEHFVSKLHLFEGQDGTDLGHEFAAIEQLGQGVQASVGDFDKKKNAANPRDIL